MRFTWMHCAAASVLALAAAPALAGLCQTPFMHDGGKVKLNGAGMLALGADLSFSEVKKSGADVCSARVQGAAQFGFAGFPQRSSDVDYWMHIQNGQARFERDDGTGKREPVQGKFDLRMIGLFAYGTPITRAGQTFPPQRFEVNFGGRKNAHRPLIIQTGERTVGQRQQIQTTRGHMSCWPVQYTRVSEPTQASFSGLVLPVPGMTAAITDWFCPDVNMVMKQDSVQSGVTSSVEVTELR